MGLEKKAKVIINNHSKITRVKKLGYRRQLLYVTTSSNAKPIFMGCKFDSDSVNTICNHLPDGMLMELARKEEVK